jgi:hypothetical protein
MSFRTPTVVAVGIALGAAVVGIVALGVSVTGVHTGLRAFGYASLGVGGLVAAVARWSRQPADVDAEARAQLALAQAALDASDPAAAAQAASKAVAAARTSRMRNRALTTLAWAALGQGYPERAKAVLDSVKPAHELDVYCLAAVECARGRPETAIQALEVARSFGTLTCDGAKLLVDCHVRANGIEHAVLAALLTRRVLGIANCEQVLTAARLAGANRAAARLDAVLRSETGALPAVDAQGR